MTDHRLNSDLVSRILMTSVCFVVGLAIAAQWRSQADLARTPMVASTMEQAILLGNLVESNAQLREEVRVLEQQILALDEDDRPDTLRALVDELTRLRIANGLVEVSGMGIELRVSGDMGVYDVQDLVNELRNAGSEAIAINGQRMVTNSVIAERGRRITVDGITTAPPYTFLAVGEPETLAEACTRRGGTLDLLQSSGNGIEGEVKHRQDLVLPVYRRSYRFRYASIVR